MNDRELWVNGEKVVSEELRPYIEGDPSFDDQFKEFALSIPENRAPMASGEEVRSVVEVMEAALTLRQKSDRLICRPFCLAVLVAKRFWRARLIEAQSDSGDVQQAKGGRDGRPVNANRDGWLIGHMDSRWADCRAAGHRRTRGVLCGSVAWQRAGGYDGRVQAPSA